MKWLLKLFTTTCVGVYICISISYYSISSSHQVLHALLSIDGFYNNVSWIWLYFIYIDTQKMGHWNLYKSCSSTILWHYDQQEKNIRSQQESLAMSYWSCQHSRRTNKSDCCTTRRWAVCTTSINMLLLLLLLLLCVCLPAEHIHRI
jgi:hypothetical protein